MDQAPAAGHNSLRTVPRNFPGRSGTRKDSVFLCSTETAAASALAGVITDPRTLDMPCPRPRPREPQQMQVDDDWFVPPLPAEQARQVDLLATDNTPPLPLLEPLPETLEVPVLLEVGDNISTDDIMPAGARVLPLTFADPADRAHLSQGRRLRIEGWCDQLAAGREVMATLNNGETLTLHHELSARQREILSAGGVINYLSRSNESSSTS